MYVCRALVYPERLEESLIVNAFRDCFVHSAFIMLLRLPERQLGGKTDLAVRQCGGCTKSDQSRDPGAPAGETRLIKFAKKYIYIYIYM